MEIRNKNHSLNATVDRKISLPLGIITIKLFYLI